MHSGRRRNAKWKKCHAASKSSQSQDREGKGKGKGKGLYT